MITGATAGEYAKIESVDTGSNSITLDRPLSALPQSGDDFRYARAGNVFANVTEAQAIAGRVDHRMLFFLKTNTGSEDNFRFYMVPVKDNGTIIEMMACGGANTLRVEDSIAVETDNPFRVWGNPFDNGNPAAADWQLANFIINRYGIAAATPVGDIGSEAVVQNAFITIWLRRNLPVHASAGECVYILYAYVSDASTQDPSADPDPFIVGFPIIFTIPEITYTLTVAADRPLITSSTARVVGTIKDSDGNPVVGLNCWLEIASGPGSLATDLDAVTDAAGQISAIYTAPSSLSSDPVFRLVVPTNPEI